MEIGRIQDIAKVVYEARIARGWSQIDLAERAGVSRRWLISLEQGEINDARLGTLLKTLDALGISLWTQSDVQKGEQMEDERLDSSPSDGLARPTSSEDILRPLRLQLASVDKSFTRSTGEAANKQNHRSDDE